MKENTKRVLLEQEDQSLIYGTPEFKKELSVDLKDLRKGRSTVAQSIAEDGSYEELDTEDSLQNKIFKYIQERLPINSFPVWVKGCIRFVRSITLPRCKEAVETRCEEQQVFADKFEIADPEDKKVYEYYKSRIPSEKGTDGIVRPDFESEEWKDFSEFRSVLFERFGLKEIHEKYLSLCINKMKAINELISLSNELDFDKSEIKGDWTAYEMAVNAVFSLLPKQVYRLIIFYKESVKAAFINDMQDRGKSQGTRNAWMSMGRYNSEYRSYDQGYKFSDLNDIEKMNWLIANAFLTIFNRIEGGFSSVDELINSDTTGETFRPEIQYNVKRAMQEIRNRIEEGTTIHENFYFNREVIGGRENKQLKMSTIYFATYPLIVRELRFTNDEYMDMLGLSRTELGDCIEMFKSIDSSKEKVEEMMRNYDRFQRIETFAGDFKPLSEFAIIDGGIADSMGVKYNTIADFFMASKTDNLAIRKAIAKKGYFNCAKTMENVPARKGWDEEVAMLQAIAKRASVDNKFRLVLKASDGIEFRNTFGGKREEDVDGYGYYLGKYRKSLIKQTAEAEAVVAQRRREAALAAIAKKEAEEAAAAKKQ